MPCLNSIQLSQGTLAIHRRGTHRFYLCTYQAPENRQKIAKLAYRLHRILNARRLGVFSHAHQAREM